MAHEIGVGGGQTVTVTEPERGMFSDNLGGALQFGTAHVVYDIMGIMGGSIGAFGAGVLVEFMDRVEPSLIKYTKPLLDMILGLDGLEPNMRKFFEQLQAPTDAGAAAILGGMAGQVGGAGLTSILSVVMAHPAQLAAAIFRPTLPNVSDTMGMWRRGELTWEAAGEILQLQGYQDAHITSLAEITQPRAGVGELVRGFFRKAITEGEFIERMKAYGFADQDIDLYSKAMRVHTDAGAAMALYRRGEIDQDGFFDRLAKLGLNTQAMDDMDKLKDLIPGPTDLVRMGLREAWDDNVARQWGYDQEFPEEFAVWMEKQGYSRDWSEKYWRAHWILPSVTNGFEMYHRGVIDKPELEELLRISDIPAEWRTRLTQVAFKPYTRVDVRRMHDMGVLTDDQVRTAYKDLGYDDVKAQAMLDFTISYNDKVGEGELTEYRDLTRSVIVSAYQKAIITQDQAETRLLDLGYDMDGIGLLLSLSTWQKDIEDAPDYMDDYRRDIKGIIEKAYSQRIISEPAAKDILAALGVGEDEASYILEAVDFWWGMDQSAEILKTIGDAYVRRGINRADALSGLGKFGLPSDMMEQKMQEWDVQRNIRSRRATEAQYRKALQMEVIGVPEYTENLKGLGYTDYDIWMFTAMAIGKEEAGPPSETGPLAVADR